jgi:hypothetical protein
MLESTCLDEIIKILTSHTNRAWNDDTKAEAATYSPGVYKYSALSSVTDDIKELIKKQRRD